MPNIGFIFDSPGWLVLLAVLPVMWWLSFRSISGLGPVRRWFVLGLRTAVIALIIFALARMQKEQTSEKLSVIYVLDQSVSIPADQRRAMSEYVNADIKKHRNKDREDKAGVIVFGRDAALEHPPFDDDIQIGHSPETRIEEDHTNLAGALKLAMATFPEDTARRVVIVTDGNENLGNAMEQARAMVDSGVGIDVVPVRYSARAEVAVERISIPPDIHRGTPFDVSVVLNNTASEASPGGGIVKGELEIIRKSSDTKTVLVRQPVELAPGKKVFRMREEIDSPDFYTYEAEFIPADKAQDPVSMNNRATTFTHVRGQGQVLLIEDMENQGEFGELVSRLRKENLQVTVRSSEAPFASLAELQPFDTIILANVPREDFSEAQIKMMVANTQQMGAGLIMLGGPNSYGAGGWTGTELEAAMPVDFQIKNKEVVPVGALAMMMHASEMPDGNHWQKKIAVAAIDAVGNQDYCGVIIWDGTDQWMWRPNLIKVGSGDNRNMMRAKMGRMVPSDMPGFDSSLSMALTAFNNLPPEVAVKHMIVISDGDPTGPMPATVAALKAAKIKVTTVGVGTHGQPDVTKLMNLAAQTGGKSYFPKSAKALPRIYQKEARAISQPLVFENKSGFQPQVKFPHEVLKGVGDAIPPITGYVLTNLKENPLVEVALVAPPYAQGGGPQAASEANRTVLATWTYGLGKAVALTTDAGKRWAGNWTQWNEYDKLFTQIVRWSMRPAGDQGKFSITTEQVDGKVRMVVTALDKNDDFLNFLNVTGSVVGPDMKPIDVKIRQTAPGRYVGDFDAPGSGTYSLMLSPGAGMSPILTGVNVPYSAEYLDRESNEGLMKALVSLEPKEGSGPGVLIEDTKRRGVEGLLETDTFRHNLPKAISTQDIWPQLMMIAACLFFADVFVRRVHVDFAWLPPLARRVRDKVLRREPQAAPIEAMERLRSRKAAISQQIEEQRASARFEPAPDAPPPPDGGLDDLGPTAAKLPPKPPGQPGVSPQQDQPKEDEYTSRLLKAKKKVWNERDDGPKP
jgi:Mg-chelatase subunit ChlD/uncharacterized membrane protein